MSASLTVAGLIDWWSIVHVVVWLSVGAVSRWRLRDSRSPWLVLALSMLIAYAWEVLELAIARAPFLWPNQERGWNRWVADPLTVLMGMPAGWYLTGLLRRRRARHRVG
jgi:hypothetical protein